MNYKRKVILTLVVLFALASCGGNINSSVETSVSSSDSSIDSNH